MSSQKITSQEIREGLVQFIGAALVSGDRKQEETRQLIAAALVEEAIKISKDEKGNIIFFSSKPILRAAQIILQEERLKYVEDLTEENITIAKSIQGAERVLDLLINRKDELV